MPILGVSAPTSGPSVFNVRDYGAVGNLATDDTTAIRAAISALRASTNSVSANPSGQTLFFPPGYYKITGPLDLTALAQVRIQGGDGRSSNYAPDTNSVPAIAYYGTGSTPAIDLRSSQACIWDGVNVYDRNSSHTGPLMSFDPITGYNLNVFGNRVENCTLSAIEGHPASLLKLAGNIEFSASNVTFNGSDANGTQIHCVDPTALAHWSNANSFRSCSFLGVRKYSVLNPGPQTLFYDCTWEPTQDNDAAPVHVAALGNETAGPVTFISCGFWDNVAGTSPWISSAVVTKAWTFIGTKFDCAPTGVLFDLANHSGLIVMDCRLTAPNAGTPNIFKPGQNITNGVWLGNDVPAPMVDNHASVFV